MLNLLQLRIGQCKFVVADIGSAVGIDVDDLLFRGLLLKNGAMHLEFKSVVVVDDDNLVRFLISLSTLHEVTLERVHLFGVDPAVIA